MFTDAEEISFFVLWNKNRGLTEPCEQIGKTLFTLK